MKIAGIRLRWHPLFAMVAATSALTGYFAELVTLFMIVVLHELGHIVAARAWGWKVVEVQLLPFGGVVVVERDGMPSALEEFAVAAAGPLQNAWLACSAAIFSWLGWLDPIWSAYFIKANMLIGLFNLLPVLPLDGGRMMHALAGIIIPYYYSLRTCLLVSLVLSAMMVAASFFPVLASAVHLNLLAVGLYLLYSNWVAWRHFPYQFMKFLLSRGTDILRLIGQGKKASPVIVRHDRSLKQMTQLLRHGRHHLFYLVDRQGNTSKIMHECQVLKLYFAMAKHASRHLLSGRGTVYSGPRIHVK